MAEQIRDPYSLTSTTHLHFIRFKLHLNTFHLIKMKSAVMAVACAAGAQAFVAPR